MDAQPRVVSPVELRGDRLCLRPCRGAYASALHRAVLESFVTLHPWMAWCHAGYEQRESEEWLRRCETQWSSGEAYEFALFDRADHYVGGAGVNDINRMYNFANLGYWIRRSRQGQALAVEAVRLLARFGFRTLGLTRIEIVAAFDNVASRRVAEKAGARLECIARNRLIVADKPVPAAVYSLVPDDPL